MAKIVLFRDSDPWFKPDATGFNKMGLVTNSKTVIYPVWRHLRKRRLDQITTRRHHLVERKLPPRRENEVATFFARNHSNFNLFELGMKHLVLSKDLSFFDNPIRLPVLEPLSPAEHEKRWLEFRHNLEPFDCISVIDANSWISRSIARLDQGTWSHTAMYFGEGKIVEAITSGVVERDVETYRFPRYRLGIYRLSALAEMQQSRMREFAFAQIGKKYNYTGVGRLCLKKLLGHRRPIPPSPNDMLVSEHLTLVFTL